MTGQLAMAPPFFNPATVARYGCRCDCHRQQFPPPTPAEKWIVLSICVPALIVGWLCFRRSKP